MTYSEEILLQLNEIVRVNGINLFEAASHYCETHDIDPGDFFDEIDSSAREQIKFAAIEGNHVRRDLRKKPAKLI
jgi:hypothetical protein